MSVPVTPDPAQVDVASCGHTTKPCTDPQTWCPQCLTPPCSQHLRRLHLAESWEALESTP